MTDLSRLGIECGVDWVPLPLAGTLDLGHWAREQAEQLAVRYARDGEKGDPRALTKDLRATAADSQERTPLGAFAWYVSGFNSAAAVAEIDAIHPDATTPEITLDWLTRLMSTDDFGEPDVSRIALPLGPAVRIRQNFAGEKKRLFGPRPLIRSLAYGVRPPSEDAALVLYASWTESVLDEPLEQVLDQMARSLSLGATES
ncbi:hypothetical protein [Streptomyces sp. NPDC088725]|uniref:hypothetical protein n=1 Tax=Streptomyces sp. NPDC088725 TaxID=3365873 RepID=UPI0037F941AA